MSIRRSMGARSVMIAVLAPVTLEPLVQQMTLARACSHESHQVVIVRMESLIFGYVVIVPPEFELGYE
jgi:hypothetical protein